MTHVNRSSRFGFAYSIVVAAGLVGCNTDRMYEQPPPRVQTTGGVGRDRALAMDVTIADQQEVDLVEEMSEHRSAYQQSLERLRDFYRAKGHADKQSWTEYELRGLRGVKSFRYVSDAEVPSGQLKPVASLEDADAMYERGLAMMRKGGHGVPIFYREKTMVEAAEVFRALIENHPTSDKIDDAAFQLGEIHKEYLRGQEPIAVKWYERSLAWNPESPHPARFQAAVIYDYRLHDRDRALELYQSVVRADEGPRSNVRFAAKRIEELIASQRTADASQPR